MCVDLWLQQADGCMHILETLSHGAPPLGSFPLSVQTFSCFISVTKYLHEAAVILAAVNRELHICSICQGVWFLSLECWLSEHPHCLLCWWRTNPFLTAIANSFYNKVCLSKGVESLLGFHLVGKQNRLLAFMSPLQHCVTLLPVQTFLARVAVMERGLAGAQKL